MNKQKQYTHLGGALTWTDEAGVYEMRIWYSWDKTKWNKKPQTKF